MAAVVSKKSPCSSTLDPPLTFPDDGSIRNHTTAGAESGSPPARTLSFSCTLALSPYCGSVSSTVGGAGAARVLSVGGSMRTAPHGIPTFSRHAESSGAVICSWIIRASDWKGEVTCMLRSTPGGAEMLSSLREQRVDW